MLSSFKSKKWNVFLPIHLWAFSNGVVLSILSWWKMFIKLIFSIKWKHEMNSFYAQNMPKLPVLCTKVDHVNWHVNWLLRRSIFVTFFSFSSWPLFSVAEKERTTGVLYVVDSSCPENIGSSTVSKVSYSNSFLIQGIPG